MWLSPLLKHFHQTDRVKFSLMLCPGKYTVRSKKGKNAGEIGPSERFIDSNEDVGGVQVVVL